MTLTYALQQEQSQVMRLAVHSLVHSGLQYLLLAVSHLRQQEKIAALQEWTSWKQWALGHADWPAFKERLRHDYGVNMTSINEAMHSSWLRAAYEEKMAIRRLSDANCNRIAIIAAMLVLLGGALVAFMGYVAEQRYSPLLTIPGLATATGSDMVPYIVV